MAETVTVTYTRGGVTLTGTTTVNDVTTGLPAGVSLQPLDGGGQAFYSKFTPRFPADFYPIAVWYQGARNATDIATDKSVGLNTYVLLDNGSVPSLIKAAGMYSVGGPMSGQTTENVGYHVDDEVDMSVTGWWGAPTAAQFTALTNDLKGAPKDGRFTHANFGKGIMFSDNDAECARMLNMVDVVSNDEYWFTDSDLFGMNQGGKLFGLGRDMTTAEVRRASNYGATVRRMRKLVNYAKPVWGFVELGGPWSYNTPTGKNAFITPPQMRAATWSSIINGAQGIIYFAHTFSPTNTSTAIQRQASYAPINTMLKSVNAQITSFAAVLNQPTATGLVTADPSKVDTLAKWNNGAPVIFAGAKENQSATVQFKVAGNWSTAIVDGENRQIGIVAGMFTDTFADGNAVHIYRIS
jgi:hypothetical protein